MVTLLEGRYSELKVWCCPCVHWSAQPHFKPGESSSPWRVAWGMQPLPWTWGKKCVPASQVINTPGFNIQWFLWHIFKVAWGQDGLLAFTAHILSLSQATEIKYIAQFGPSGGPTSSFQDLAQCQWSLGWDVASLALTASSEVAGKLDAGRAGGSVKLSFSVMQTSQQLLDN